MTKKLLFTACFAVYCILASAANYRTYIAHTVNSSTNAYTIWVDSDTQFGENVIGQIQYTPAGGGATVFTGFVTASFNNTGYPGANWRLAISNVPIGATNVQLELANTNQGGGQYGWTGFFTMNAQFPVILTSFKAQSQSRGIDLIWSTAQELNSSHFNIERSANGTDWKAIGRAEAANYASDARLYQFTDNQALVGKNYYRLQQVDLDGKLEYSPIVIAHKGGRIAASIYPNPVVDVLTIQSDETALVELIDKHGRIVKTWMSNEQISLNDQTPGMYQVRLTLDEAVETMTILKQ
jgi:hypothetical protein